MLGRTGPAEVVNVDHHAVAGGEGDDRHPRGPLGHLEAGQQLADELELVEEVGDAHAGGAVHQEDQVDLAFT